MATVQIVLDKELLKATDQAARRSKQNRSELVRQALREHLHRLAEKELEDRDREAYTRQPQTREEQEEIELWEAEAAWPTE